MWQAVAAALQHAVAVSSCQRAPPYRATTRHPVRPPAALQALVHAADVAPWTTFYMLCTRRQFKLLGRDMELLQGRVMQVGWGCCWGMADVAGLWPSLPPVHRVR